jgi:hypothetical protein
MPYNIGWLSFTPIRENWQKLQWVASYYQPGAFIGGVQIRQGSAELRYPRRSVCLLREIRTPSRHEDPNCCWMIH